MTLGQGAVHQRATGILTFAQRPVPESYSRKIAIAWRLLSNKDIAAAVIQNAELNNQKAIVELVETFTNAIYLIDASPEKEVWEQYTIDLLM